MSTTAKTEKNASKNNSFEKQNKRYNNMRKKKFRLSYIKTFCLNNSVTFSKALRNE